MSSVVNKTSRQTLVYFGNAFFVFVLAAFLFAGPYARGNDAVLASAFEHQQSVQVEGHGVVVRILADDLSGSRHQKFILELASGQTLLVAHNIDLAPRINDLSVGDSVSFYGEYEWNSLGGVIHWTHADPAMRHVGGWLQHKGVIYQ